MSGVSVTWVPLRMAFGPSIEGAIAGIEETRAPSGSQLEGVMAILRLVVVFLGLFGAD